MRFGKAPLHVQLERRNRRRPRPMRAIGPIANPTTNATADMIFVYRGDFINT